MNGWICKHDYEYTNQYKVNGGMKKNEFVMSVRNVAKKKY